MIRFELGSNWTMHQVGEKKEFEAVVPGTVYTDLLSNGEMEDPYFKDNEDKALALMDYDYEYKCVFPLQRELLGQEHVLLRFEGLDTIADIYLNDNHIGSTQNMHRTYEFEVKSLLKDSNELRVVLHSPNKFCKDAFEKEPTRGSEDAMPGFVKIRKAHCMFGWDWGAHLPDAGIFRPVSLVGYSSARIDNVEILQHHKGGSVTLEIAANIRISGEEQKVFALTGKDSARIQNIRANETDILPAIYRNHTDTCSDERFTYAATITYPDNTQKRYENAPCTIEIEKPMLWWPNGYGEHPLYTIMVELIDTKNKSVLDSYETRIGLRTMTMSTEKDEWGNDFAVTVNGVKIFTMGGDYIPEDHIISRVNPKTTRELLEKAVFANFNAIRVWGGGYYPSDWFYDICDELGLVVWQDFMFACGDYDLTPDFEANIVAEFRDNILRIRNHASLGLLCGNNEMESFMDSELWLTKISEKRDYILMYERILPQMCHELAQQTYYWPSSPSSGGSFDNPNDPNRGDQHYWDVWHGNKPFTDYRKYFFRFASEFGFQSFPLMKTIEMMSDDPKDYNIFSYVMERHQRNGAANGKIMNYMQQTYLYPTSFDTLVYASQLLQADGIKYGVEHFRRNRGRCMGAVIWQLNDCWPVASWSSIDYGGRLKALHYYAKRFFAPVLLSCNEEGQMSSEKQFNQLPKEFPKSIQLCLSNEKRNDISVTIKWQVRDALANLLEGHEETIEAPALSSKWLEKVDLPEIDIRNQYVSYGAYIDGEEVSGGTVNLSRPKYFNYADPELSFEINGDEITVHAKAYASSVEILNENQDIILSDNYFDMNAGSKTVKILSGKSDNIRLRSVYDIR